MKYWVILALFCQGLQAATMHRRSSVGEGSEVSVDGIPRMRPIASKGSKAPMTDFGSMEAAAAQASSTSTQAFVQAASDPATPQGYSLVFGPTNGATGAPGHLEKFMGFKTLATYDVAACASFCNAQNPDSDGGACKFFNIWQAVINGTVGQTTCAMYFTPTDGSTATNFGTPTTVVSQSRGYARVTLLPDGGFEALPPCARGLPFCSANGDATWTLVTTSSSTNTASQILRLDGAHSGTVFATIGFFDSTNTGIWTPANPINTVPGSSYVITYFYRLTGSLPTSGLSTNFAVFWNGVAVSSPRPTDFDWHYYQVEVVAQGNDLLRFTDNFMNSQIATSAIDDIFVFQV